MTKNIIVALKCSLWNDESRKIRITQSNIASWKEQSSIIDYDESINDDDVNQFNITCKELQHFLKFKILQFITEQTNQCQSKREYGPNLDIKIEVYDNHQSSSFVSLLHDDVRDQDVEKRFGKRLQCFAMILDHNNKQSYPFKKTGDETIPAIMGRYFPFDPQDGIDFVGGKLVLKEINNNQINATGLNIWDGAILMVKYLELFPDKIVSKRVLELGSGCGPVGIAAGILGANQVIMTDLPYTLNIMRHNIISNMERIKNSNCTKIECIACDWFDPPHVSTFDFVIDDDDDDKDDVYPDVILIADCVWLEELVDPLFQTISKYVSTSVSSPKTEVIITYQQRGNATHQSFINNLHKSFSLVNEISISDHRLQYPENLFIYSCK